MAGHQPRHPTQIRIILYLKNKNKQYCWGAGGQPRHPAAHYAYGHIIQRLPFKYGTLLYGRAAQHGSGPPSTSTVLNAVQRCLKIFKRGFKLSNSSNAVKLKYAVGLFMAGSGFDHPTSAQQMRISTNSPNHDFGESAHTLLFKPSFICAPKDGQERARKTRQWNLEQCAGGGGTMI